MSVARKLWVLDRLDLLRLRLLGGSLATVCQTDGSAGSEPTWRELKLRADRQDCGLATVGCQETWRFWGPMW